MILPIAATPFLGDDIFNSYINGAIGWDGHTTFWQFLADINANYISGGRFFPGALLETYGLFHIMPSLPVYKTFQVLITLANVFTFYVLLREFRMPRAIALLGVVVLLCTFQMRVYYDGLLGQSGDIEVITELALLSMYLLQRFLRRGESWALVGSIAAYAAVLLIYEITYLLWLALLVVLIASVPRRRALQLVTPYFVLSALAICIQLYVKSAAHLKADADYNLSLNLGLLIATFAKQALAAVPFTYVLIDPSNMFAHGAGVFRNVPFWVSIAIFAVAALATWTLDTQLDRSDIPLTGIRALAAAGPILWLTPALLVASSVRYQRELVFGLGHAPVYVEYFGVSMVIVAALAYAARRWGVPSRSVRLIVAMAFGLAASVMYASNVDVIATHVSDSDGISNMNAALEYGLMSDVPAGSDLFVDLTIPLNRYLEGSPANPKYYYFFKTGKRLAVHYLGMLPKQVPCSGECRLPRNSYELINIPIGPNAGFDALGKLSAFSSSGGEIRSFASAVVLFVRGVPSETPLALQYMEHGCRHADRVVSRTLSPQPSGTEMIRLASGCGSIEMNTIAISAVVAIR
jgi:hypothetical protein